MLAAGPFAQAEELRVGVYPNAPKLVPEGTQSPSGIFGDLLHAIATREGWELEAVPCDWQTCLARLEEGTLDLLPDVAWSEARADVMAFHDEPVLHSWSQVYQRPGSSLDTLLDLDGRRLAVLEGSIQADYLRHLETSFGIDIAFEPVDRYEQAFAAVRDGRVDAAVANRHFGDWQSPEYGLTVTPILFQPARLYYAAPRFRHADKLARIDAYLRRWKADPASPYYATLSRWSVHRDAASGIPILWWWGLGALAVLLALALSGNLLLRRRVAERSARLAESERHRTYYAPLTGLPNRNLLMDRLDQAIAACRGNERLAALLLIDLDQFKLVNDLQSHVAGDHLLQGVAQRLVEATRDLDTLAHLGGDEFALLIQGMEPPVDDAALRTERVAQKLLRAIQSARQSTEDPAVTGSIGITLFSDEGATAGSVLQQGDMALAQAKTDGGNTWRFFNADMQHAVMARVRLENDLQQALARQALHLHYQPLVNDRGQAIGVEALLRWQHPERGPISPAEFIPLAEQSQLILPIGHWVLEQACHQLAAWARDPARAHLMIAVNVSSVQFHSPEFVAELDALLATTGARPERLALEVTESLLLEEPERVRETLATLRQRGIHLALDDFGTGYSSLAYLKRLPLDKLKIDRSFINGIPDDAADTAIVETTLTLARNLGLKVVAEGVETAEQFAWLKARGCEVFQGYHFGHPAAVEQLVLPA